MQFSVDRCSSGLKELRKHLQDKKKKKNQNLQFLKFLHTLRNGLILFNKNPFE